MAGKKFNVTVIGQNISPIGKDRMLKLVREHCPEVRILELHPQYASRALEDADAWLEMPTNPQDLVVAVNSLALGKKN